MEMPFFVAVQMNLNGRDTIDFLFIENTAKVLYLDI
jgi:hypothetical protein